MSDSFFDFDTSLTSCNDGLDQEDGEDEDYDALNEETFGESNLTSDWEENHEKLAAELTGQSRRSFDDENGELSERIASYILDDEGEDMQIKPENSCRKLPKTMQWWANSQKAQILTSLATSTPIPVKTGPPVVPTMCTVEEVERNLRSKASLAPGTPPPGVRLEDLERELTGNTLQFPLSTSMPGKIGPPGSAPPGFPNPRTDHPSVVQSYHMHVPNKFMLFKPSVFRLPLPPMPILNPQDEFSLFHHQQQHHQYQRPYNNSFHPVADEYAGLMSMQEKQWLASIQLMQLSTNQPFQDDYYFQMYQSRQQGKCGHKMGVHGMKNNRSESVMSNKPVYTPLQFENSLGKLQVGSVTAPRKIIDMDVVESIECGSQNSSRKCKQLLLEIEKMYSQVLLIEEFHSPFVASKPDVNPVEIMRKLNNVLLLNNKLVSIMSIKKGKTLVLRILPHLENPGPVIHRLISNLMVISRKDTEQTLLRFLPVIRIWLASANLHTLVQLSSTFENSLSKVLTNKFTVSVLANMIERAETVLPSANDNEVKDWLQLVSRLLDTAQQVTTIERPVVGVDGNMLSRHLSRSTSGEKQDFSILRRALSNLPISDIKIKM